MPNAVGRAVRRTAMRKGLLGGERAWFAIWVLLALVKLLKRLGGPDEEVVFRQELKPGEGFVISAGEARTKGGS